MRSHLSHRLSRLFLVASLAGCSGSHGSFDAQNAPFGNRTPTTVSHSTVQLGPVSVNGITQVVGDKTISGKTYSRLTYTNTSDPSSGVEWWIDEKPGKSVTLAGWDGHSQLAESLLLPPGVVLLDQPVTVSLNPPLNTPQPGSNGAAITIAGDTTPHRGQATSQYTLVEDNATADTSMGTIFGCKHFSGSTTLSSDLLPATLAGLPLTGDVWYHPSYGVVAFNSPEIGLGLKMTDTSDCGAPDADGFAIVRKVSIVDPAHPFRVSTHDDCSHQFDADKDEHAKMLLELRWADDSKAKAGGVDTLGPMLAVEFGDSFGYFPFAPTKSQVSIFHPEENGQGFTYYYGYVSQADKYMSPNGIEYYISVGVDSGTSPIRATGRIYYKKFPVGGESGQGGTTGTGTGGVGGIAGAGGKGGTSGIGGAGGIRDAGGVDAPGADGFAGATADVGGTDGFGGIRDAGGADAPGADVSIGTTADAGGTDGAGGIRDASGVDTASADGFPGATADAGGTDSLSGIRDAGGVDASGADGTSLPSTGNLIVNGDAEQGSGSPDGSPVATPGWTVTGEATALQYGASGGYPAATDPGPTNRGLNLFAGGASDATSTLTQTISLASYSTSIDAGRVTFALQGYLGGYTSQDDNAVLSVSLQNAGGTELASATIGPVTSTDRNGATALLLRSTSGSVPVGARSAVVTLTMTRLAGTANDGYADNLSLLLTGI